MKRDMRSAFLAIALAAALAPALQGCFPVLATGFGNQKMQGKRKQK